ncbi:MAG: hypothetical protein AAFX05_08580 [Planctomycetota bacterium]
MTLVLVKPVFIAKRAGGIFQLRLADPAAILIPVVLSTPQAAGITFRRITDEARIVGTVSVQSAGRFIRIVSTRTACGVAEVALVLVEMVLLAVRARRVLQLRLANPAAILVPRVLGAPEAASVTLGRVADEARVVRVV